MHGLYRWLLLLPFKLAAMALAIILSPVIAFYSVRVKIAWLTGWLGWMQTADNSLDALWQQPQHLIGYGHLHRFRASDFEESLFLRWWARTLWLMRNPAAGLSDYWGVETAGMTPESLFERGKWDSGKSMVRLQIWRDAAGRVVAWQLQAQVFYRRDHPQFLRANLGWKSVSNRSRLIMTIHVNPFRTWRV